MLRLVRRNEGVLRFAGFGALLMLVATAISAATWDVVLDNLVDHVQRPAVLLILQIAVILAVAKVFSKTLRAMGQPGVIGEILAGIALGPSLLAYFFPDFAQFLFPASSLATLEVVSHLGLMLFMFAVGIELESGEIRSNLKGAIAVGLAALIVPFVAGGMLAFFLHEQFAARIPYIPFILFMAISLSITAFPVLARIVHERRLSHERVGVLALSSAAFVDVAAWITLAIVLTIAQAGAPQNAVVTILLALLYVLVMLLFVRPILRTLVTRFTTESKIPGTALTIILCTLLLSSLATELIGIHALFGAFLAGFIMPSELSVRSLIRKRIVDMSSLLLPLFFVSTGLKTNIGLLTSFSLWGYCLLVIAVAVFGKVAGSTVAARATGYTWSESWAVGALMNTRGLVELIVLNIGYQLGLLPPALFTILVIMAIATTMMTGPLLSYVQRRSE